MAIRYEGKRLREVRAYKRKSLSGRTVIVDSYIQRYDKPRGPINPNRKADSLTAKSRTIWLKNRHGRFVGRANYRGKTTAKGVVLARVDTTTNFRERGRYGRVYGRAKAQ